MPTDRFSDGQLRRLADLYGDMARDPALPTHLVEWYSRLSLEIREVLIGRDNRWLDITSDRSTWPPDWETAVEALK